MVQFLVDLIFLKLSEGKYNYLKTPRLPLIRQAVSSVTPTFFSFLALVFSFLGKGFSQGNFFITFGEWESAESVSITLATFLH